MELQNAISLQTLANISLLLLALSLVPMHLSVNHASATNDRLHNVTDRLALLEVKHHMSDPYGVLSSWNHSQNHCQWQGVTCSAKHQRVIALTLAGKSLSGSISPHIGNLSFLKFVHLEENQFHGEIPQEIGRLFRLRFLNLSFNAFIGEIPVNLCQCLKLRVVDLMQNNLEGKFPSELGSLQNLETLYLAENNLTGEIPSSIGNMSSLERLSLAFNNLEGNMPKEISLLINLSALFVGSNKLSGAIHASISNISAIVNLSIASNYFYGSIPTNIGLALPNLKLLAIGGNKFYGRIPISITNASGLQKLDLSDNKLEGLPTNLGDLSNLQMLNLEKNLFGSSSTGDLDFIASLTNCSNLRAIALDANNFGGKLPKVIANLSDQLTELFIGENQLQGTIPQGLGKLVNLYILDMSKNFLSAGIPSDFGTFQNLQYLGFRQNRLSGNILSTLCNVTTLNHLDLSRNRFEGQDVFGNVLMNCQNLQVLYLYQNNLSGVISPDFFNTHSSLVYLILAQNRFNGSVPLEVGKLTHMAFFDISYNKFSGEIPTTVGNILQLEYLSMQGNFFQGILPENLATLKGIQELDLSSNNLRGQIPKDIEKLQFLRYLNLSYNDLEGEIPSTGVFANASQISLIGNDKLCGGIPELDLPPCHFIKRKNKGKHKVIIIFSTILPVTVVLLGILFFYLVIYRKAYTIRIAGLFMVSTRVDKLIRVSYHELHRATSGFSPENLVGSGSFGRVYRGRLDEHGDRLVAIKVLDLQKNGASKSFKAECETLRNIRHRNLVSILSYCSSIDSKGDEFKALVYEFMENGNLGLWLHPETTDQETGPRNLNLLQRLNIAIDVASSLHYLHNHCETTVVHCDLKPSNILLDEDLVAHVGDFGLARLLPKTINTTSEQGTSSTIAVKGSIGYATPEGTSSTIAIKGSIGYAAPEYGMGLASSTQGDVYSYGILLLEMITGRQPTDSMFMDGLDLHSYVNMALPEQVFKVVDPMLLRKGDKNREITAGEEVTNSEREMECILSLLKIGLKCSARLPNDRMNMNEVTRKLHLVKHGFLGGVKIQKENINV